VIRAIEHAARLERDDDDARRTEKIRRLVARTGPRSSDVTALITELFSAVGGRSAPSASPAAQQQELVFEALVGIVAAFARERPVLFILEDGHWIDPTTQDLMHRIVDLAGAAPILVLVTHRPGYKPPWAGRPHVSQLSLSRLTAREVSVMANQLAGDGYLSEDVRAQIAVRTDGMPLYVEALTRAILVSRPPRETASSLSLLSAIPEEIPTTLWDLLLSQLDQLDEAGEVARIGAAIGRSFGRELLCEVADLPTDTLDAALHRLIASGLVFATATSRRAQFVFKHALVREAAYQGLTRDRRQRLHARIAQGLVSGISDTSVVEPEILAQHFEQADQLDQALAYWSRAGEVAARRYAHTEAVAHFRRAVALLGPEPEDGGRHRAEADLMAKLGRSAIVALGDGHPEVREIYLRLESLSTSLDDERLRCDVLFGVSQHAQVREHVDRSLAIANRYVEAARRLGDRRQLAIAHWIRAQDYWRSGRFAAGLAEARSGREAFDERQPVADLIEHPGIVNRTVEAYCACMLGQVERALRDLRAMAEESREAANPMTSERTFAVLGVTYQLLRDVDETASVVQQMTALPQTHRPRRHGDWLALLRAWVLTAQGDMGSGVAHATNAMQGLEIKSRLPRRLSILADCFAAAGRIDTAQELITRALVETEARGERFFEAELHRQQGEVVLAAGGAVDAAEASFERALAIARAQEARLLELKAAVSRGRLWTRYGRSEDATALVGPVAATFDRGFGFPDLRDACTLLHLAKTA
jgi:tetratricopeptide (TPR) repeat protein